MLLLLCGRMTVAFMSSWQIRVARRCVFVDWSSLVGKDSVGSGLPLGVVLTGWAWLGWGLPSGGSWLGWVWLAETVSGVDFG